MFGSVYIYIQTYNVAPIWADGAFNLNRLKTNKLGTGELALLLQKPTLTQTKRKLPQVPGVHAEPGDVRAHSQKTKTKGGWGVRGGVAAAATLG